MLLFHYNILLLAGPNHVSCVWPQPNVHFSYKLAFCRDKTMARQISAFVVGVRFGLKKDGFAWECPQKVKKTSSDMLGFEKCVVKTYIFRTWCPQG